MSAMLTATFARIVTQTGSPAAAWMLIAGVALGLLLIAASVLNPESRGVRWLKALAVVAAALAVAGSWRVEEPQAARTRTVAAQVPVLQERTVKLDARVAELEAENKSLQAQIESLNNQVGTLNDQVGTQKALGAAALAEADRQMTALANTLGKFDETADGVTRFTLPGDLVFPANESTLQPEQREALAKLVGFLMLQTSLPLRNKVTSIRVIGHTDNTKVTDPDRVRRNQILSENRANAVADYLMSQKLSVPIAREGKGMSAPKEAKEEFDIPLSQESIVTIDRLNDDADKRRANRRVELLLIKENK